MGLSLFCLVESVLLIINALAILNERRFLRKCKRVLELDGLDQESLKHLDMSSVKGQIGMLLFSARRYGICKWA